MQLVPAVAVQLVCKTINLKLAAAQEVENVAWQLEGCWFHPCVPHGQGHGALEQDVQLLTAVNKCKKKKKEKGFIPVYYTATY